MLTERLFRRVLPHKQPHVPRAAVGLPIENSGTSTVSGSTSVLVVPPAERMEPIRSRRLSAPVFQMQYAMFRSLRAPSSNPDSRNRATEG